MNKEVAMIPAKAMGLCPSSRTEPTASTKTMKKEAINGWCMILYTITQTRAATLAETAVKTAVKPR